MNTSWRIVHYILYECHSRKNCFISLPLTKALIVSCMTFNSVLRWDSGGKKPGVCCQARNRQLTFNGISGSRYIWENRIKSMNSCSRLVSLLSASWTHSLLYTECNTSMPQYACNTTELNHNFTCLLLERHNLNNPALCTETSTSFCSQFALTRVSRINVRH